MRIANDCAVSFQFILKDASGQVLSASSETVPLSYLHGYGQMVPGLERALLGRAAGETLHVRLAPEDAYGLRDERNREILPRQDFSEGELAAGNRVYIMGTQGPRQVTVLSYDEHSVVCDTNHELAGMALEFEVHILSVRKATIHELGCGHVHDP
ncbi:MAG: peptidylprolyl isomerase [Gammaproteobacteria bacterium]|nr:peptidylprolyl isomerase [Gammaproteobacteria bacterium]